MFNLSDINFPLKSLNQNQKAQTAPKSPHVSAHRGCTAAPVTSRTCRDTTMSSSDVSVRGTVGMACHHSGVKRGKNEGRSK